MIVHEIMTTHPVTVRTGTTLKTALLLLDQNDVSSLPVVDGAGHVTGVVSEADLIRELVSPDQRLHELPLTDRDRPPTYVDEVMTNHAITVRPQTDVVEAVDLVTSTGVKCLPVVDDDKTLVGVLSRRDVVRILARPDDELERDADALLVAAGRPHWLVNVHDGLAEVAGPETPEERSLATAAVRAVPGVIAVHVE